MKHICARVSVTPQDDEWRTGRITLPDAQVHVEVGDG
jgi:hypothetical protein